MPRDDVDPTAWADADWWRRAVIYQIYPRSFYDSNGDGVGDLPGVTAKLDYVASLGVDAIWLSPFFTSPMRDFGYDVADHRAVDPLFGTLDDFDALLRRAHALGLRVIIDLICGHTSDEHGWFRESRAGRTGAKADWYVWADPRPDGTPPNNWLSVFGGAAWTWEPRRRQYYLHHFLASQPTLNLRNPAVVEALLDTARFWLERGVDGFRMDAVDFLLHDPLLRDNPAKAPPDGMTPVKPFGLQQHVHDMAQPETVDLLRSFRALVDRHGGAVLLGEVSSQEGAFARIARYTAEGRGLHMAYTLRPLRCATVDAAMDAALAEIATADEGGHICWAFSNHDVERAASRWDPACAGAPSDKSDGRVPDPAFVKLLMALLLSLPGSACLYQGEELGLAEARLGLAELRDPFGIAYYPEYRGRDGSRTPMPWREDAPHAGFTAGEAPWLPVPDAHRRSSAAGQEIDPAAPLHVWRRLLAWRKRHPALLDGRLRRLELPRPLLGFERVHGVERVVAIFNPSARPAGVSAADYPDAADIVIDGLPSRADGDIVVVPPYGAMLAECGSPCGSVRPCVRSFGAKRRRKAGNQRAPRSRTSPSRAIKLPGNSAFACTAMASSVSSPFRG